VLRCQPKTREEAEGRRRTGAASDEKNGIKLFRRVSGAVRSFEGDEAVDFVTAFDRETLLDVVRHVLRQAAVDAEEEADLLRVLRVGLNRGVRSREGVDLTVQPRLAKEVDSPCEAEEDGKSVLVVDFGGGNETRRTEADVEVLSSLPLALEGDVELDGAVDDRKASLVSRETDVEALVGDVSDVHSPAADALEDPDTSSGIAVRLHRRTVCGMGSKEVSAR
jgi:hypothetical protein